MPGWAIALVAVLALAVLAAAPEGPGEPLDPRSSRPLGTRGLVLLLEDVGAEVRITDEMPGPDDDTALLAEDVLDGDRLDELEAWVRDGGRLLVADPGSPLQPSRGRASSGVAGTDLELAETVELEPGCAEPVPAFDDVGPLAGRVPIPLRPRDGAVGCWERGSGWAVVVAPLGDGAVIGLGGAAPLTNELLDEAGNARFAAAALAPEPGTRVAYLRPLPAGAGDAGLVDLIPDGAWHLLWQLAVAAILVALWRGRRLGRPVEEPQPVDVAASELVVAVGDLLQRAGRSDEAARRLRAAARDHACERLGLPRATAPEHVAAVVAARTSLARDRIDAALIDTPTPSEEALVRVARAVDEVRTEISHG